MNPVAIPNPVEPNSSIAMLVAKDAALIFTRLFQINMVVINFFGSFFSFNSDLEPFRFCSYNVFTLILFNETSAVSLPDEIADKITKTTNNVKLIKSTKF